MAIIGATGSRGWLAHPRIAPAVELLRSTPTGAQVVNDLERLPTRVVFLDPPRSLEELVNRETASYRPLTNTMALPSDFGPIDLGSTGNPGSSIGVLVERDSPATQAGIFAHEGIHRIQNRRASLVRSAMSSMPVRATFAGVRDAGRRAEGQSIAAAFSTAVRRTYARHEIEAYRVQSRIAHELGEPAAFHSADGTFVGDDAVFANIANEYARGHLRLYAGGMLLIGSASLGTAYAGARALGSRD